HRAGEAGVARGLRAAARRAEDRGRVVVRWIEEARAHRGAGLVGRGLARIVPRGGERGVGAGADTDDRRVDLVADRRGGELERIADGRAGRAQDAAVDVEVAVARERRAVVALVPRDHDRAVGARRDAEALVAGREVG